MSRLAQLRARRDALRQEVATHRQAVRTSVEHGRSWLASVSLGLAAGRALASALAGKPPGPAAAADPSLALVSAVGRAALRHPWWSLAAGVALAWLLDRRAPRG